MKKFLWSVCFSFCLVHDLFAAPEGTATIFAFGQGGSVLIKAQKDTGAPSVGVMVDAGSSEMSHTARQLNKVSETETLFLIRQFTRPDRSATSEEDTFDDPAVECPDEEITALPAAAATSAADSAMEDLAAERESITPGKAGRLNDDRSKRFDASLYMKRLCWESSCLSDIS